jgi:hypothetical protein
VVVAVQENSDCKLFYYLLFHQLSRDANGFTSRASLGLDIPVFLTTLVCILIILSPDWFRSLAN